MYMYMYSVCVCTFAPSLRLVFLSPAAVLKGKVSRVLAAVIKCTL